MKKENQNIPGKDNIYSKVTISVKTLDLIITLGISLILVLIAVSVW